MQHQQGACGLAAATNQTGGGSVTLTKRISNTRGGISNNSRRRVSNTRGRISNTKSGGVRGASSNIAKHNPKISVRNPPRECQTHSRGRISTDTRGRTLIFEPSRMMLVTLAVRALLSRTGSDTCGRIEHSQALSGADLQHSLTAGR